jgi:hypothetical protein
LCSQKTLTKPIQGILFSGLMIAGLNLHTQFHTMKKFISVSGFGALVIALMMTSCVSKKKYVQAQQTIEKYRMDSAQMAQNAASQQQNISSLEEKNRGIQTQLDSSKAATQAEIQRWSGLQGYYDEERTNITNIHQQLHTALAESDVIKADEITASNGRVYVTLDDQVFSGGQLSTKGKKAIADFAGVLKDKQDLIVDVASGDSYAAYWSNGSTAISNTDASSTTATTSTTDASTTTSKSDDHTAVTEKAPAASVSSSNASSRPAARTHTTTTHKSTATAHRSSTATKSSASKSTAKKSESGHKMTFKSGSSKSNNSWNSKMAKANAIAKELHKNGIYNVGLMVPGSANTSDVGTSTGKKNFQLIVSPKTARYYQMMESSSAGGK